MNKKQNDASAPPHAKSKTVKPKSVTFTPTGTRFSARVRGDSVSQKEGDKVQGVEEDDEEETVDLDEELAEKLEEVEDDEESDDSVTSDDEVDDEYQPQKRQRLQKKKEPVAEVTDEALDQRDQDAINAAKAKFGLPVKGGGDVGKRTTDILEDSDEESETSNHAARKDVGKKD